MPNDCGNVEVSIDPAHSAGILHGECTTLQCNDVTDCFRLEHGGKESVVTKLDDYVIALINVLSKTGTDW